jgi:hypothetical protein
MVIAIVVFVVTVVLVSLFIMASRSILLVIISVCIPWHL